MGKIRAPFYRVVVMDARAKRDGRAIEEIGKYHPTAEPSLIDIDSERAQHWLSVGAQPTEQVRALLTVTGDWAKFTGEGDPAGSLRPPAEPSLIDIDSDRAQHWLSVGAQPTEQVQALLKVTGDWAKFTGEGDPEGSLRPVPEPRDKKALYEAALAAADGAESTGSPSTRSPKKSVPPAEDGPAPADKDNVSADAAAVDETGDAGASSSGDESTAPQA